MLDNVHSLATMPQIAGEVGSIPGQGRSPGKHLNAEFQRIATRDKKAFFSDQCEEIEESNRMEKIRDLFKKIRDTKGTFHAKMSSIKDRNGMDFYVYEIPSQEYWSGLPCPPPGDLPDPCCCPSHRLLKVPPPTHQTHQPQASSIVHRTWTGNSFHT